MLSFRSPKIQFAHESSVPGVAHTIRKMSKQPDLPIGKPTQFDRFVRVDPPDFASRVAQRKLVPHRATYRGRSDSRRCSTIADQGSARLSDLLAGPLAEYEANRPSRPASRSTAHAGAVGSPPWAADRFT